MTLNITLLTTNVIYQSADFLLWDPERSKVVTDVSNKTVTVHMREWEGSATYTGIGRWKNKDTSQWIIDWLTGSDNLSFDEVTELILDKGSDWLNKIKKATHKHWHHTFILTAFVKGVPTVALLSNFQNFNREPGSQPPLSDLQLSVTRQMSTPRVVVTGCLEEAVSRQKRRYLERLARDHPHDPARIRQALSGANKSAATTSKNCPISKECIVQSFDRSGHGFQSGAPLGVMNRQLIDGVDVGKILDEVAAELLGNNYKMQGATSVSTGRPSMTAKLCNPLLSDIPSSHAHELVELSPGMNRNSSAFSVNIAGHAVGSSNHAAEQPQVACRWVDQSLEFLPDLGGISGQATDINSAGLVVGWAEDRERYAQGCLWTSDGRLTVLEFEGAYQTAATCIVDGGAVGGWASFHPSDRGQLQNRPSLWASDGSHRSMPNFMADWGQIVAMNNRGTAVVLGYIKQIAVTYLWRGDDILDLGPIYPVGIDDLDRVVGFTRDMNGNAMTLRWDYSSGWQKLEIPSGWQPTANSPEGVIAGSVELDGWKRPWICKPSSPPSLLPHFSYHHTTVTRLLNSLHAAGYASTDHGTHAVVWRMTSSA